jgi:hypothetical protein
MAAYHASPSNATSTQPHKPAAVTSPTTPAKKSTSASVTRRRATVNVTTATAWSVDLQLTTNANKNTLVATSNQNLSKSGYYLQIFDETSGTRLKYCSTSDYICISISWTGVPNGSTTQTASVPHTYVAIIGSLSASYPPATIAAVSQEYTAAAWSATLPTTIANNKLTLTATTNYDVLNSGFYLQIFDKTTGVRLNYCSSNSYSCTSVSWTGVPYGSTTQTASVPHTYVAIVGSLSTSYPPAIVAAASQEYTAAAWSATLTSSITNYKVTLVATSNYDLANSGYYLQIFDEVTGARLAYCSVNGGVPCTSTSWTGVPYGGTTQTAQVAHKYIAVVGPIVSTYPPAVIAATSTEYAAATWSVALAGSISNSALTLSASANYELAHSGYELTIFDTTTGARMGYCSVSGIACHSLSVTRQVNSGLGDTYVAVVANLHGEFGS